MARPVFTKVAVNRPALAIGIVDFVYVEQSTLQRGARDHENAPVCKGQRSVIGTVEEHCRASYKGLLDWVKDVNFIVGAGPGKPSGDQHMSIRQRRHGVIRTWDKHSCRQTCESLREWIEHLSRVGGCP